MHILGHFDVFTTKTSLTRVRAVPRHNVTFDTLEALNTVHPTIGIMPSGLPWVDLSTKDDYSLGHVTADCNEGRGHVDSQIEMKKNQYFYSVPYSEHSCFTEIHEFIMAFQPAVVTGIVSSSICYINPRHYFRRLRGASRLFYRPSRGIKNVTGKKAGARQGESIAACRYSGKPTSTREAKGKFASLSVRRSRICVLRRRGHGAKIADIIGSRNSDSESKDHMDCKARQVLESCN